MMPECGELEVRCIGSWKGFLLRMHNANLVLVTAAKGYVMCGYLNMETAERLGDAACIVTGVKGFDDLLDAKVVKVSSKARDYGIRDGVTGKDALEILS